MVTRKDIEGATDGRPLAAKFDSAVFREVPDAVSRNVLLAA
jgi:hypothetical protein